jgi:hypothetical protein
MIWLAIAAVGLVVLFAIGSLLHSLVGYGRWR